ncbi:peptidoglycan-binding domain-containing protein [Calothrix sp. 336/3]|uniref:peptidoglycan-binding domain-containing protein n=1 Tax=Calothrix sp. 336/3 TaxID=1337936 RepID=UPI0004E37A39|nr:peptidoglycan-binding domain-containing protein [Calothrix sp. 336/3]AKG20643.1 peptidoglycan-binding protein [Calothrix sp. 336/3]
MKLQEVLEKKNQLGYDAIAKDVDLSKQIQSQLVNLNLLQPPVDGKFGPTSIAALKEFQELVKASEQEFLGPITAKQLLEMKQEMLPKPSVNLGNDLGSRIIKYMMAKNYRVFTEPKEYNIVYVEGMNENGTLNNDAPNAFNDRRIVIEFNNGVPRIVNQWQATTEPGSHYTYTPMNPAGAARIKFGQYKSWSVGMHGNSDRHEALIQVTPITVHRDFNKDFKRIGDKTDTGLFAVNQHWGYDAPQNDIKNASAGCLVGRMRQGHREFMALIKQDRRYTRNPGYVFYTTIIPGDDLVKMFPG